LDDRVGCAALVALRKRLKYDLSLAWLVFLPLP
jgi:putative aminopeptidase FrvX